MVNTSRCRQRRNMTISSTTATTIAGCQVNAVALIQLARSVSQGVRTAASCRSSQVLAWSPIRSHPVRSETANAPVTRMAASASHAVALGPIRCGSGGGAPVGRR